MLRFSTLIVMLALVGNSSTAIAAPQGKSSQCYNEQTCMAACFKGGGHYCNGWCQRRAASLPPCK
jgi:hypothetical protein